MDELKRKEVIKGLLDRIRAKARGLHTPIKLMEVCGTHTMAIHRYGLKKMLLDAGIEMLTGPGCPVCITPSEFHEAAIRLVTAAASSAWPSKTAPMKINPSAAVAFR